MLSDLNYEKAYLASLFKFSEEAYASTSFISEASFSDQTNAILFTVCKKIIDGGNKPDLASVLSTAKDMGFENCFTSKEDLTYIRAITNFPALASNVEMYAAKLKKIEIINSIGITCDSIKRDIQKFNGSEPIGQIVDIVDGPISKIVNSIFSSETDKPVMLFEGMEDYVYEVLEDPTKFSGHKTGFPAYDEAIGGGLRRAGVDVVAGRPKSGKSSMGLQVALNLANKGIPVLIVDTEMTVDGQRNRVIANQAHVDINEFTSGEIKKKQAKFEKVIKTAQEKKSLPIYHINVSGREFKNILAIISQWVRSVVGRDENGKTKDCLIVYDYLKLTTNDDISKNMQEYQVLGFQMTSLYNFMVKYDCPCLAFVQLNRDMEASQSDRIVWLCTSFTKFLLKSDDEKSDDVAKGIDPPYNRKLEVTQSRFGPGTEFGNYINVRMRGQFAKLDPGPTRNEVEQGDIEVEIPDISTVGHDTDAPFSDEGGI